MWILIVLSLLSGDRRVMGTYETQQECAAAAWPISVRQVEIAVICEEGA